MLDTIYLNTWSEFEGIIKKQLRDETQMPVTVTCFFRGHSDSSWSLETTLERSMGSNQDAESYYRDIQKIQHQVETFTDRNWDLPSPEDYLKSLINPTQELSRHSASAYLQYLRHFAYPSPLLDWTYSPFVAAYFAFRDISSKSNSIAIHKFFAEDYVGRYPATEDPHIFPIYSASPKNKRHYHQQSVYTLCLKKINNNIVFASHEDPSFFSEGRNFPIIKYVLPSSERITALHSLEAYNINGYSLMGTEESLLETLFLRQYKWEQANRRLFPDMYQE